VSAQQPRALRTCLMPPSPSCCPALQAEAQHFSLSSLDLRCANWFFLVRPACLAGAQPALPARLPGCGAACLPACLPALVVQYVLVFCCWVGQTCMQPAQPWARGPTYTQPFYFQRVLLS
jgi:hypothetical protein